MFMLTNKIILSKLQTILCQFIISLFRGWFQHLKSAADVRRVAANIYKVFNCQGLVYLILFVTICVRVAPCFMSLIVNHHVWSVRCTVFLTVVRLDNYFGPEVVEGPRSIHKTSNNND